MRNIKAKLIRDTVIKLVRKASFDLRPDVIAALRSALNKEKNQRAKRMLQAILDNARIAKSDKLAICQDTGLPVVFAEIGQDAHIVGGSLKEAINQGIASGYKQAYLRNSIIKAPLQRGRPGFTPAVIHTEIVAGNKIKLTLLPKGFGCENKSKVKMFNPTAPISAVREFIVDAVKEAGPDACPPYVVGVGIGGTADYACLLAKKALLESVGRHASGVMRKIEKELLAEINNLNIGPMGLGGKTTCLGVNILTYPTHIAGLPVAVNISCHALRSAAEVI